MSDVYFAHSMLDYNTEREKLIRDDLESHLLDGMKLVCPNRDLQKLFGKDMNAYLAYVKTCDLVIVLEHGGFVGKGVYLEVETAVDANIPVLVLRDSLLYHVKGVVAFDRNDWKNKYGKLVVGDVVRGKSAETVQQQTIDG